MKISFIFLLFFMLCSNTLFGQCSDAGICVIGSKHATLGQKISVGYVFGKSGKTDVLTIHSIHADWSIKLFRHSRIAILLPWSRTNGPLGYASGIGDLTVLWNQTLWDLPGKQINAQIGGKFATGNANSRNLPQAYQPGLGTNDLLLGISYETEPWLFALGYQLSRGRSNNSITRLSRGDDLLARIGYKTHVDEVLFRFEILGIKRLHESSVLDRAAVSENSFITVSGSDQFQINILTTVSLPISENISLRSLAAVPLRSRSVNVDGLTRSISLSLGVEYSL